MSRVIIKRNETIDFMKGILIILVVLGHIIQYVIYPESYNQEFAFRLIYSFHMPLFMFISGYTEALVHDKLSLNRTVKRFISLFIPFALWAVVKGITVNGVNKELFDFIGGVFLHPDNGLWFLEVLALCYLFLYITRCLFKYVRYWSYLIVCAILIVNPIKLFGFELLKIHFTYFVLGFLYSDLKKRRIDKFINNKSEKYVIISSTIFFPIAVLFWISGQQPLFMESITQLDIIRSSNLAQFVVLTFGKAFTVYLVPITGIICISFLLSRFYRFFAEKGKNVVYLGSHTIEIYAMHFYFICLTQFQGMILNAFSGFVLGVTLPLIIGSILRKNKVTAFLFLGVYPSSSKIS